MKTVFKYFSILEYDREAEYLSEMHAQGWKLTGITLPGLYHFEACEPEQVSYQLDYNQEGVKHKAEYVQMFKDCGWEYILDFVGYSYFRKPAESAEKNEEIFCDNESRLEMLKRIFLGRMLPLLALFAAVVLPNFIRLAPYGEEPRMTLWLFYTVLFILYIVIFGKFGIDYLKFKNRLK